MHEAFKRVKDHFKDHDDLKRAFFQLRNGIHEYVSGCTKNVKVTIYIDNILDDPIEVLAGAGDNDLVINIEEDANVKYRWTKETWVKKINDAWNQVQSTLERIIDHITSEASTLLTVIGTNRLAITGR